MMNVHNPNGPAPAMTIHDGPYFPTWATFPAGSFTSYNFDMYGDAEHQGPMDNTVLTGKPTFEVATDYLGDVEKDLRYQMLKGNTYMDYQDDAHSVGLFPIFDGFGQL